MRCEGRRAVGWQCFVVWMRKRGIHGLVHCFCMNYCYGGREGKGERGIISNERVSEYTKRRWMCV